MAIQAVNDEVVAWIEKTFSVSIANSEVRRVVIDITVGNVVRIFVEKFGNAKMLESGICPSEVELFGK